MKYKQMEPAIPQQPQPSYSDRSFLHSWVAGAGLPLAQAGITAVMIMIFTTAMLYMFDAIDYLKPIIITGALTFVGTWIILQRRWLRLTSLEQFLRIDINGDGKIGNKEPKPETVIRIDEVKANGHYQSMTYRLKISDEDLVMLADGLINRGRPLSRREWTPKTKGFSDDVYRDLQSDLLKFGLAEPQGTGFGLTRPGQAMMKYYARLSPTPVISNAEK